MDFEALLTLQTLDTRLDQLEYRRTHDETIAARDLAQAAVIEAQAPIEAAEAQRHTVQRELKRFEDEAALTEDKISKHETTLYGGTVTAHKELEAIQAEIAMLKKRLSEIEDHELEQMELLEPLDAQIAELSVQRDERAALLDTAERAVTVAMTELEVEVDAARAERSEIAATVDPSLVARYEDLRTRLGGQGAARLAPGGRCEGCHLTLPSAEYSDIKRRPADEIVQCPECDRILVR